MEKIELNDVIKCLQNMDKIFDYICELPGVWTADVCPSASRELRDDLLTFVIYLAVAGNGSNGINNGLIDYVEKVLRFKTTEEFISGFVLSAKGNYETYTERMLCGGQPSIIIDACDAEDNLRNIGVNTSVSLPRRISALYEIVGRSFIGDSPSKNEIQAFNMYIMKINSFLSDEGYYD